MAGGRPLKYDAATFEAEIAAYWPLLGTMQMMPTKSGLLLHLHLSRETWREYKEREEFVDAIKRAELTIEDGWVQRLTNQACTGAIFYLKNAFKEDYRDSKDITSDGKALPTPILGGATKDE